MGLSHDISRSKQPLEKPISAWLSSATRKKTDVSSKNVIILQEAISTNQLDQKIKKKTHTNI
jgi:hypothetical protein